MRRFFMFYNISMQEILWYRQVIKTRGIASTFFLPFSEPPISNLQPLNPATVESQQKRIRLVYRINCGYEVAPFCHTILAAFLRY